jgi:hypothetical protein
MFYVRILCTLLISIQLWGVGGGRGLQVSLVQIVSACKYLYLNKHPRAELNCIVCELIKEFNSNKLFAKVIEQHNRFENSIFEA